ncbi:hypothetical protein M378DRAFT_800709 [Amanita muscaria Koide BX008]|uniref:Uncharacterized protein n=1 Tax=Amanita muscaria (strain Koide BX008) TaxID=946122 RepID=A0A0C2T6F1_AMAMK|nr:hypothetical protein M378DRAFT_800709 [Amanita muscaria Koide BX008]
MGSRGSNCFLVSSLLAVFEKKMTLAGCQRLMCQKRKEYMNPSFMRFDSEHPPMPESEEQHTWSGCVLSTPDPARSQKRFSGGLTEHTPYTPCYSCELPDPRVQRAKVQEHTGKKEKRRETHLRSIDPPLLLLV